MLCDLVRVEIHPNTAPFRLAPIQNNSHPKTVAILEMDGELLPKATRAEAVPILDLYCVGYWQLVQQAH